MPERDYRKYLDPKVLAKISGLELRARLIIEGFFSGIHHSPQRGLSVEFADHRAYTQGDDLRRIDWKVFGKTDKYYVKEYEQETNLNLMLVVDCSESMSYRSGEEGMTKHEYATAIAVSQRADGSKRVDIPSCMPGRITMAPLFVYEWFVRWRNGRNASCMLSAAGRLCIGP